MRGASGLILIGGEWNIRAGIARELAQGGWRAVPVDSYDEVDAALFADGIVACKMESEEDIARITRRMARDGIWFPIIACTAPGEGASERALIADAYRVGAQGHLAWPFGVKELERLVNSAAPAMRREANRRNAQSMARRRLSTLTARERDVLQALIVHGSNKRIAHELGLSPRTVEIYRSRILQRLGADHIAQAIWIAFQSGEIGPDIITQAPAAGQAHDIGMADTSEDALLKKMASIK